MTVVTPIDDQPVAATFFGEGQWLTDFITPEALEVIKLYKNITQGVEFTEDRLLDCWQWVANNVKYVKFVNAKIQINGNISVQEDYWQKPSMLIRTKVGNCANKSFLLCSLLRNELPADRTRVVLGNLYQKSKPGGHAWCEVTYKGKNYIFESTRGDMQPMVASDKADIYEPVIYFNDEMVSAIEGRTLLEPFCAVYADWLRDYLDWAYIKGNK